MKTLKTKKIGNHEIVSGFGLLSIDPEATKLQNVEAIFALDEARALKLKLEEFETAISGIEISKEQIEEFQQQIKILSLEFNQAAKEALRQNPVYFGKKSGELLDADLPGVTVDQLFEKWKVKGKRQILIDGKEIDDFRGCQYFYKDNQGLWNESEIITDLGVSMSTVVVDEYEAQAIEKADLTGEQLEEIRFQKLTAEEKAAEKMTAIDLKAAEAANMRSKLEIQGDSEALSKSQAWYNEQLIEINEKYA
jgi:hypothetical protein